MKKALICAVGVAFLMVVSGAAFAQQNTDDDPIKMEQKRKKQEAEDVDKRYQSTLQRTRGSTPAPVDPWSNMRGDDSKTKR
jgi:uncharacterized protein YxeA